MLWKGGAEIFVHAKFNNYEKEAAVSGKFAFKSFIVFLSLGHPNRNYGQKKQWLQQWLNVEREWKLEKQLADIMYQ